MAKNIPKYRAQTILLIQKVLQETLLDPPTFSKALITRKNFLPIIKAGKYHPIIVAETIEDITLRLLINETKPTDFNRVTTRRFTLKKDAASRIANRIDELLRKYPHNYHSLIELPPLQALHSSYPQNSDIQLVKVSRLEEKKYTTANPNVSLLTSFVSSFPNVALSNPEQSKFYMKVTSKGDVGVNRFNLANNDPVYVYKNFYSLCLLKGLLEFDKTFWPKDELVKSSFHISVYDANYFRVQVLVRAGSEARLKSNYKFKSTLKPQEIKTTIDDVSNLFKDDIQNIDTEKLRNRIINSMYWHFESSANTHTGLAAMFLVSSIDSFFDPKDKSQMKSRVVAEIASKTASEYKDIYESLLNLYKYRNSIVHGEQAMHSFVRSGPEEIEDYLTLERKVKYAYKKFIFSQIDKFKAGL